MANNNAKVIKKAEGNECGITNSDCGMVNKNERFTLRVLRLRSISPRPGFGERYT